MASSSLSLLTGATGFIGFEVLFQALQAGHLVRCAVRSQNKAESILSNTNIKALNAKNKLSFVQVPDILVKGAYDEALKEVDYVIHLASPIPVPGSDPGMILESTVKGTSNLLHGALKTSSLKRVVITSSIVANLAFPPQMSNISTASTRLPELEGPFKDAFTAYRAAKISTLNAVDAFIEKQKPHFCITNIIPGFVYGPNKQATSTKKLLTGSNRALITALKGEKSEMPRLAGVAHIEDVAKVHLLALRPQFEGSQDYGVTFSVVYDDAFDIAKRHFPKAFETGFLKQGSQPSMPVAWDASDTERTFGISFKTYEKIVCDLVGQMLELERAEKI
ncbi:hypothetical protein MMC10_001606 [Thelotrema lepadinum]|nr:hypothetical protein [Thelotrema lepadinum]